MRLLAMIKFHIKLFASNSYFVWLMLTSTTSIMLLQYLSAYGSGNLDDNSIWLRAGIFGLWSCAMTAAGSIGFQRFQGTLIYLLSGRISPQLALVAVIAPAASFGLLSFPVAALLAFILGLKVQFSFSLFALIILFWLGAVICSFLVTAIFVLTPRAITYEAVLVVPILLFAGLFSLPANLSWITMIGEWFIPITVPTKLILTNQSVTSIALIKFVISSFLWLFSAYFLSEFLFKKAKQTGELGGIGL